MRVLMLSNHCYPSFRPVGSGLKPTEFPSGSGGHVQDLLARGLGELGHQVFYLLRGGHSVPLPEGVEFVSEPIDGADIYQTTGAPGSELISSFATRHGLPWILTCHLDRTGSNGAAPAGDNWIFVSHSLAQTYRKSRVVLNGLDPADFRYSASKERFLLFMASAEHALTKGLKTAIAVARRCGIRLVVAGTGGSHEAIERIEAICRDGGADYIGDIRGTGKADWLAAATAVLLPSRANEGCPLTLIEALMSGTPVLTSDAGGIPEVVSPDVGYICHSEDDYVDAVARLDQISSERCRAYAIERFHYQRMVRDYVREFEHEIARVAGHSRA
ncbi:glycosyltransferase [Bradyrhizobium diazoefficiens]|nr:glycosyltransferase [Bradyrhizobium diazoefficiens]MBR0774239.1 glycosyltransferase [Bradyrhizobium diazoefficiens]